MIEQLRLIGDEPLGRLERLVHFARRNVFLFASIYGQVLGAAGTMSFTSVKEIS
jgi:hypothetical protein